MDNLRLNAVSGAMMFDQLSDTGIDMLGVANKLLTQNPGNKPMSQEDFNTIHTSLICGFSVSYDDNGKAKVKVKPEPFSQPIIAKMLGDRVLHLYLPKVSKAGHDDVRVTLNGKNEIHDADGKKITGINLVKLANKKLQEKLEYLSSVTMNQWKVDPKFHPNAKSGDTMKKYIKRNWLDSTPTSVL